MDSSRRRTTLGQPATLRNPKGSLQVSAVCSRGMRCVGMTCCMRMDSQVRWKRSWMLKVYARARALFSDLADTAVKACLMVPSCCEIVRCCTWTRSTAAERRLDRRTRPAQARRPRETVTGMELSSGAPIVWFASSTRKNGDWRRSARIAGGMPTSESMRRCLDCGVTMVIESRIALDVSSRRSRVWCGRGCGQWKSSGPENGCESVTTSVKSEARCQDSRRLVFVSADSVGFLGWNGAERRRVLVSDGELVW